MQYPAILGFYITADVEELGEVQKVIDSVTCKITTIHWQLLSPLLTKDLERQFQVRNGCSLEGFQQYFLTCENFWLLTHHYYYISQVRRVPQVHPKCNAVAVIIDRNASTSSGIHYSKLCAYQVCN